MTQRRSIGELPSQRGPKMAALIEQSAPSSSRPIVNDALDKALAPGERRAAASYAAMEDAAIGLRDLAAEIDKLDDGTPLLAFQDEDSTVHHIVEALEVMRKVKEDE